jgi:hypothetical protein
MGMCRLFQLALKIHNKKYSSSDFGRTSLPAASIVLYQVSESIPRL